MKLLSAAVTFLSLLPLPILADKVVDYQRPMKAKNLPVKGNNPLEYCADPSPHLLQIDSVDLKPNPPVPYVYLFCDP